MSDILENEEWMTYDELRDLQKEENKEIVEALLADGSDEEALYTIEHHISGDDFSVLENLAVVAFKEGFEVFEAEETEDEEGEKILSMDLVMDSALDLEQINQQTAKLIDLAEEYEVSYDGWGTYFENGEEEDTDEE